MPAAWRTGGGQGIKGAKIRTATLTILILLLLVSHAQAARLIQASLQPGGHGSRLILSLDSRVDYSLDLIDPQNIVLRLPGTVSAAIMPQTGRDPVIEAITANSNSQGLDIIIRTRAAGSTVQPSMGPDNKLVLEIGPSSGQTQAAPAPAIQGTPLVHELKLSGKPDSINLELGSDQPVRGRIVSQGDIVYLRLEKGAMASDIQISGGDSRVLAMQVENPSPFSLAFKLSRPLASYSLTPLETGLTLDLRLGDSRAIAPPPPPKPVSGSSPARPTTVSVPPPDIAPSQVPEGPVPVVSATFAPTTPAAQAEQGADEPALFAPSAPAVIKGGSARGGLPPKPPQATAQAGGLSVDASAADDGPPATVGARLSQGGSAPGYDLASLAPAADLQVAQAFLDHGRYAEALTSYEMVLNAKPGYDKAARASYGQAEANFRMHQEEIVPYYTRILDLYQAAMVNYPDSDQIPRALLMMGRAASLAGENYRARAYYDVVNTRYRRSDSAGWAQIYTGQLDLSEGNYKQAIKVFEDVLSRWKQGEFLNDAQMGLLQAYFGMGQWAQAVTLIEEMLQSQPDFYLKRPELLHYMGECKYQLQDYPQAREYMLWAINLNPKIVDGDIILTRIGDTYRYEKAYRAASEMYNLTTMMFPNSDGSQVAKMRLSEESEEDKENPWEIFQVRPTGTAMKIYREVAANYADRPVGQMAQLKMAVWYYKTAAFAQSLQAGINLLHYHPDTMFKDEVIYLMNLAAMARLRELRDELNAVQLLEEYVRLRPYLKEPESNDVLDKLAWGYEQTGLNQKAAHLYKVLGSRILYKPQYWVDAARNYFTEGQFNEAVATLHEVNLDELPEAVQKEFLFLEGVSLSRLGKHKESVLALLALLQKGQEEDNGEIYQNLGISLSHMEGRSQDALNALDLAERAYVKQEDNSQTRNPRLLVALQAGLLSKRLGETDKSLAYLQKALLLSDTPNDKAPILYEIFLAQRALGKNEEMIKSLNDLAALKVEPWSSRAESILLDFKLAPNLERMGRDLQQRGNSGS